MTTNLSDSQKLYSYRYPHPSVTVDTVVFGYDKDGLHVLLVERGGEPYKGCWALPGGFLNMDECAADGAMRELYEETHLKLSHVRQLGAFSTPDRDPRERVITIAHYAVVNMEDVKAGDDAADAEWFSLDNLPRLAFDHAEIIAEALTALRRLAMFEPVGFDVFPDIFPLQDLVHFYTSMFGQPVDKTDLTEKLMRQGLLVKTDCVEVATGGCDGNCYHFDRDRCEAWGHDGFHPIL